MHPGLTIEMDVIMYDIIIVHCSTVLYVTSSRATSDSSERSSKVDSKSLESLFDFDISSDTNVL